MLINTNKFAFAVAIAAGLAWAVCSVLVMFLPGFMTGLTGHMLHMDLNESGLTLSVSGFILGFLGWVVLAGGFGWLMGAFYNYFVGKNEPNA